MAVYLFIDEEGKVGQSNDEPTSFDFEAAGDGRLDIIKVVFKQGLIEQYCPETADWVEPDEAETVEEQNQKFHVMG